MRDPITIVDVRRVAKVTTNALRRLGQLEETESLHVAREVDGFILLEVEDGNGERTTLHSALDLVGFNGRLDEGPRQAYYILAHLNRALNGWATDFEQLVRVQTELRELER